MRPSRKCFPAQWRPIAQKRPTNKSPPGSPESHCIRKPVPDAVRVFTDAAGALGKHDLCDLLPRLRYYAGSAGSVPGNGLRPGQLLPSFQPYMGVPRASLRGQSQVARAPPAESHPRRCPDPNQCQPCGFRHNLAPYLASREGRTVDVDVPKTPMELGQLRCEAEPASPSTRFSVPLIEPEVLPLCV